MMLGPDNKSQVIQHDRLLATLQRLLAIQALELGPALTEACTLVADVLLADKLDVFLHEQDTQSLVALGTSDTPMGRRQHALGLHRQALVNGGTAARVFQTGQPHWTGQASRDPDQIKGIIDDLGVRSTIDVPLEVHGKRRGVLHAASGRSDAFTAEDQDFLAAVSKWIGLVTHRAELVEQLAAEAERRGSRRAAEEIARLTPRQVETATAIAEGLTNEQIAERYGVTPGTVANYVERILRRLNLRRRTQIAVWAVERGLYQSGRSGDEGEDGVLSPHNDDT